MGTFFEQIAKAARQYDSADKDHRDKIAYAAALHAAQKQVRAQPQWSSPYYWAPFVLIGPPQ
jgi:CHAT domain-containing protein